MSVILITGSNSGIGLATALHLASKGHRVYASMRDLTRGNDLREAAAAQNLAIEIVRLDVNDESSVKETVGEILAKENRIDVLINNAGIGPLGAIEETDDAVTKAVFETNFFGAMRAVRAVLPQMREQRSGTIVNVSSVAGRVAAACMGIYAASKFALEAASEVLAQEVLPYNIRVRLVEPGFVVTPILNAALESLPANSVYPNVVERAQMLFAQGQQTGDQPQIVAAAIESILDSTEPQLRYPIGDGAKALIAGRARMSDEDWIALHRHASHADYFAEFARRFPFPTR